MKQPKLITALILTALLVTSCEVVPIPNPQDSTQGPDTLPPVTIITTDAQTEEPAPKGSVGLAIRVGSDGTCTVVGMGTCTDTEVEVPSKIEGFAVVAIGEDAFAGNTAIVSVILPEGVETIGENAFASCSSLAVMTLPASLRRIGRGAFLRCSNLNGVNFMNTDGWRNEAGQWYDSLNDPTKAANSLRLDGDFMWYCDPDATMPPPQTEPEPHESETPSPEPSESESEAPESEG